MATLAIEVRSSGLYNDTIAAIATGRGGAIAVIRVSGADAVAVADKIFRAKNGKPLSDAAGYTVHFGEITGEAAEVVDEVLVTVFRAPQSYTGEDSVEISCHASPYIENRIMQLLISAGVRAAEPGEFTVRAFLAGKLDLSEAEAVADLIASTDRAQHRVALAQMKGGVSSALALLRLELLELAALLELELDFGEEDVEFASRPRLAELTRGIHTEIDKLASSFSLGNAIREGIPVAIVGKPNAGKSTLLNALAGDDRAMVSEIAGTTRDRIEERVNIGGVGFRFIDTAGIRSTDDPLERMGIDRTMEAAGRAHIVLLVVDGGNDLRETGCTEHDFEADVAVQVAGLDLRCDQKLCVVLNKTDLGTPPTVAYESLAISAKTGRGVDELRGWLAATVDRGALEAGATVVSNARHYEALVRAREAAGRVLEGLGVSVAPVSEIEERTTQPAGPLSVSATADLLAEEIREILFNLGSITGEVTTDEILGTIFSRFCVGK